MSQPPGTPAWRELLDRLAARGYDGERYREQGLLGRGGMGEVVEVHDQDLERQLAMKTARKFQGGDDPRRLGRFLDEARITSQLDHPGIVPVHELGLRADGSPYYTMKLVRGRTLKDLLDDRGGAGLPRLVGILLKVGEAMAYAHAKGVIHRDLKPSNVMVGRFGEVHVMDWGLARVLGSQAAAVAERAEPQTEIVEASLRTPDSPLGTREGDAMGTPSYMAPEQARGDLARIGPRSDVYAVGALLYEILAGHAPFLSPTELASGRNLGAHLLAGPPRSLAQAAPAADEELVAICERAMAREPSGRFPDMQQLNDQLRAWLEGRVVSVHRSGPWVEFRKWCRRNRGTAAALGALVVVVAASGFGLARSERGRRVEVERRAEAEQRELALSRLEQLVEDAARLDRSDPAQFPVLQAWLAQVAGLRAELARHVPEPERQLAALRTRGRLSDADAVPWSLFKLRRHLDRVREVLAEKQAILDGTKTGDAVRARATLDVTGPHLGVLEPELRRREAAWELSRRWEFDAPADAGDHAALVRVIAVLADLSGADGLEARVAEWRDAARGLVDGPDGSWATARASIADRGACPLYDGLLIEPQVGLEPLRRNEATGLWEFWHRVSGERPATGPDGRWLLTPATGLVLVLVPGGDVLLGAQAADASAEGYHPWAQPQEATPRELRVEPFFLAAHELTQAQWARLADAWPAEHFVGSSGRLGELFDEPPASSIHPVESVSFADASAQLPRWGLRLPTEAQWTRAADAGTGRPFAFGDGESTGWEDTEIAYARLLPFVNSGYEFAVLQYVQSAGTTPADPGWATARRTTDGHLHHGPVGSYAANAFGLHDLAGNVAEWCQDWYAFSLADADVIGVVQGTGELRPRELSGISVRGGSYLTDNPANLRIAARSYELPDRSRGDLGLRPSRPLQP